MEGRIGFIPISNWCWSRWQKYPDVCKSNFRPVRTHIFHKIHPNDFCLTGYRCQKTDKGAVAPRNVISCLGPCTGITAAHPSPEANLTQLMLFQPPLWKLVSSTPNPAPLPRLVLHRLPHQESRPRGLIATPTDLKEFWKWSRKKTQPNNPQCFKVQEYLLTLLNFPTSSTANSNSEGQWVEKVIKKKISALLFFSLWDMPQISKILSWQDQIWKGRPYFINSL